MPRFVEKVILAFSRIINRFRKAQRGILRIAFEDDLNRVMTFINEARRNDPEYTQTLGVRTEEEYEKAIMNGSCYVIEVEGEIIAVACVFSFPDGGSNGYELGSLCVAPRSYEGFGIQAAVMPLGVITALIKTTKA